MEKPESSKGDFSPNETLRLEDSIELINGTYEPT